MIKELGIKWNVTFIQTIWLHTWTHAYYLNIFVVFIKVQNWMSYLVFETIFVYIDSICTISVVHTKNLFTYYQFNNKEDCIKIVLDCAEVPWIERNTCFCFGFGSFAPHVLRRLRIFCGSSSFKIKSTLINFNALLSDRVTEKIITEFYLSLLCKNVKNCIWQFDNKSRKVLHDCNNFIHQCNCIMLGSYLEFDLLFHFFSRSNQIDAEDKFFPFVVRLSLLF